MTCASCKETYESAFDEDFIEGICLPCRSQAEHDAWVAEENRQMELYNKKFNTGYTYSTFWDACENGKIETQTLKGFPRMREIYDYAQAIQAEYNYWEYKTEYERIHGKQGDLFNNPEDDDLPF